MLVPPTTAAYTFKPILIQLLAAGGRLVTVTIAGPVGIIWTPARGARTRALLAAKLLGRPWTWRWRWRDVHALIPCVAAEGARAARVGFGPGVACLVPLNALRRIVGLQDGVASGRRVRGSRNERRYGLCARVGVLCVQVIRGMHRSLPRQHR